MASIGLSPLDIGRAITRHDYHHHLATDIIILGTAPLELENGSASEPAFKWHGSGGGTMPYHAVTFVALGDGGGRPDPLIPCRS